MIHAAAERDWNGVRFSASSLERYYYIYRQLGFAGLVEKPRADKGKTRKLTADPQDVDKRLAHGRVPLFKVKKNVAPRPTSAWAQIRPPCR
jgi:hypothetical protein